MADFVLKRGLKDIYVARVIVDNNATSGIARGYMANVIGRLIPAGEMSRTTNTDKTDIYFDDVVFATVGKEGATEITISGAALSPFFMANLFPRKQIVDTETNAILDTGEYDGTYWALGGTAETIEGQEEKFWFLKGTFSIPEQNDKTADDTTDTNGMTFVYSAIPTTHVFTNGNSTAKSVVIDTSKTEMKYEEVMHRDYIWENQVITPDNLSTYCQEIEEPEETDEDDEDENNED